MGGASLEQASDGGATLLFSSCQAGHEEVVKLLLAEGARVDQADNKGATPLFITSQNGHQGVAKLLLANGAESEPGRQRRSSLPSS